MRRKRRKGGGRQHNVTIESVGMRGDGHARISPAKISPAKISPAGEEKNLFIPFALPEEELHVCETSHTQAGIVCRIIEILSISPERVEPPCPHFGSCGGCQLQHWNREAYLNWKQECAKNALARVGPGSVPVGALRLAYGANFPQNRRRARLAFERNQQEVRIGFRARALHKLEQVDQCLVLMPEILTLVEGLKPWLMDAFNPGESGEIQINVLNEDQDQAALADVTLIVDREPDNNAFIAVNKLRLVNEKQPDKLRPVNEKQPDKLRPVNESSPPGLARVTWEYGCHYATPIVEFASPAHVISGIRVSVPYDSFLQPSKDGSKILTDLVLGFVSSIKTSVPLKIADLFAGIGTFALPLAVHLQAQVKTYEVSRYATEALKQAALQPENAPKLKHFSCEQRNLEAWPLRAEQLDQFDVLVLNPPRAGAKKQVKEIAASGVSHVIYVSCNPSSFSRDAQTLTEAGFSLQPVVPVDQFPWTYHVELVACFIRC